MAASSSRIYNKVASKLFTTRMLIIGTYEDESYRDSLTTLNTITRQLADVFSEDNPNFDAHQFFEASGMI